MTVRLTRHHLETDMPVRNGSSRIIPAGRAVSLMCKGLGSKTLVSVRLSRSGDVVLGFSVRAMSPDRRGFVRTSGVSQAKATGKIKAGSWLMCSRGGTVAKKLRGCRGIGQSLTTAGSSEQLLILLCGCLL